MILRRMALLITGILPLLLLGQTQNVEDQFGARPLGMGRAFVAISDDGNSSYWNPAGMQFITGRERIATGMFSRLFMGIDGDAIGEGYLSYIHHFNKAGSVSLSMTHLFSNIWSESSFNLAYAKQLNKKLSLGINGRMLMNAITKSGISYTELPGHASAGIGSPLDDPLLDNTTRLGFTGGVGAMYRPTRNLSFGLNASNLNQPSMIWSEEGEIGYTDEAIEASRVPMTIRAGGAYTYHDQITFALDFRYAAKKVNGGNQFKPYGGLEYWFSNKTIALRTGGNPEEYAFGFSYRSKKFLDMQLDYAFVYPLTEIRKAGVTSHKLSVSLRFLPPPQPLYDLELSSSNMTIYPKNAIIGEDIKITAKIRNIGEQAVKSYTVTLYYNDTEKGWINAAAPQFIDEKLDVGEDKTVEFSWKSSKKGVYQFFASVDDDGTMIPDLHGNIIEIDEFNNKGSIDCKVFPLPEGTISPLENQLEISELTLVREEEPVVPVFFFDPKSDKIDDRFQHLINILSKRLKDNPDISIDIAGYYSPESEAPNMPEYGERLATNRAKAVRSIFAMHTNEIVNQLSVKSISEYDPQISRSGLTEGIDYAGEVDIQRKEAENRRAQLFTKVKGFEDFKLALYFDKDQDKVDEARLSTLKSRAEDIRKVMERNPEIIFLIEGSTTANENNPVELAFNRATNIKKALGDILGKEFVKKYSDRIFVKANTDYNVENGRADIQISGESLVYRPLEGTLAASGYDMNQDQINFVNITSNVEAGVANWKVSIVDDNNETFVTLGEGSGAIPDGVPWNWKDAAGNLINPQGKYRCKLEITDKLGQSITTFSDTIDVNVTKRQQLLETLVLVQFTFDEKISESPFLESRVELVARKFIEKALEPKTKMTALVGGHTDEIGMDHRNIQLSRERAMKQEVNLRRYLIYLLGLKTNQDLESWLRAHNTSLTSEGFADSKPYIIDKWVDGKLDRENIGQNELPEGRTINRRVVIEFYIEKKGDEIKGSEKIPPQSKLD